MPPSLSVGGETVEYTVRRGAGKRYTYFRFKPDLTLDVVLPRTGKVDPETAIKSRLGWIVREYRRVSAARRVLEVGKVMYGGAYLEIVYSPDCRAELVPELDRGRVFTPTTDKRATKELIRRWFLKETSSYVVPEVSDLAPLLGVRPSRVDVREIGKWGYCTRGGRLSFSWQLAALPDRLREYVVLHELTHLRVFSHSRQFRTILSGVCPDFRERERELDAIIPYSRLALA